MSWHNYPPSRADRGTISPPDYHIIEEMAAVPHARISETIRSAPEYPPPTTSSPLSPNHLYDYYSPHNNNQSPSYKKEACPPLHDSVSPPRLLPGRYSDRDVPRESRLITPVSNGIRSKNRRLTDFLAKIDHQTASSHNKQISKVFNSPTKQNRKQQHTANFLFQENTSNNDTTNTPLFSSSYSLPTNTPRSQSTPLRLSTPVVHSKSPKFKHASNFFFATDNEEDEVYFSAESLKSQSPIFCRKSQSDSVKPLSILRRPSTQSSQISGADDIKFQYYPRLLSGPSPFDDECGIDELNSSHSSGNRNENIYSKQIERLNDQDLQEQSEGAVLDSVEEFDVWDAHTDQYENYAETAW